MRMFNQSFLSFSATVISGSFTFASLMDDFVTGSRVHISHTHAYWTKFFLFSGSDYQLFYPNFSPSFSRHAALEYAVIAERLTCKDRFAVTAYEKS